MTNTRRDDARRSPDVAAPDPTPDDAPSILVVDDTPGNRYTVTRLLTRAGMRVIEAASGREALSQVDAGPDLVVLDINLPDLSGYDVCRAIKGNPETSWIPVMHVSASYIADADRVYGLEAGADAYLTHPLEPSVFIATTRALLRVGRAEARLRHANAEWRATFDAIHDVILLVDPAGVVRRCNRAAADLLGWEPREVVGQRWTAVLDRLGVPADDALRRVPGGSIPAGHHVHVGGRWFAVTASGTTGAVSGGDPFVTCVMADVTAQQQAARERELLLERAETTRAEAQAANRAKSDFLAVMSHELRTPLNAIAGYAELMAMGVRGPTTEAQQKDLERIRRAQATLTHVINDILSFAKIESGSLEYEIGVVPVQAAMERAVELVAPQAITKGLQLTQVPSAATLEMVADSDKLQQILLNLLTNAVKFTPPGGDITVSATDSDANVTVRVVDTGPGIPLDRQATIFDPFVQVDQRRTREHSGVGLGLSIGRELARAMGGDLTVSSTPGAGAAFSLTLPRQRRDATASGTASSPPQR